MIAKVKSFSKTGANIERILESNAYQISDQDLENILYTKTKIMSNLKRKSNPKYIEGFDRVTSRNAPSSFQLFNTKDNNHELDYQNKKDTVMSKTLYYPVRKDSDQRLSLLFSQTKILSKREEQKKDNCHKLKQCNNENIKTANDLLDCQRTYHSFDFRKQSERPFDKSLKKLSVDTFLKGSTLGEQQDAKMRSTFNRTQSVHNFKSYSKRDFLSAKKLPNTPITSGIDGYKVNPQKYKKQWKSYSQPKFEKSSKKHPNRYDRDSEPWANLNYNPKLIVTKTKSMIDFGKQTNRQENIVKSKYPIRLAA